MENYISFIKGFYKNPETSLLDKTGVYYMAGLISFIGYVIAKSAYAMTQAYRPITYFRSTGVFESGLRVVIVRVLAFVVLVFVAKIILETMTQGSFTLKFLLEKFGIVLMPAFLLTLLALPLFYLTSTLASMLVGYAYIMEFVGIFGATASLCKNNLARTASLTILVYYLSIRILELLF